MKNWIFCEYNLSRIGSFSNIFLHLTKNKHEINYLLHVLIFSRFFKGMIYLHPRFFESLDLLFYPYFRRQDFFSLIVGRENQIVLNYKLEKQMILTNLFCCGYVFLVSTGGKYYQISFFVIVKVQTSVCYTLLSS